MTTQDPSGPEPATDVSPLLLHSWVAAGIVSAAARFVPIPFIDDVIRGQCRRFVIARTLAAHDHPIQAGDIKPYYADNTGCVSGCAGQLLRAPLRLLLFPFRKAIAIATSVRGVPLEILYVVLLGRTLDRYLRAGTLSHATSPRTTAGRMRAAFAEAFARMDFHVVRAAMSDALSSVRGWKEAATASAATLARGSGAKEPDLRTLPEIETSADRVQEVLARPETLKLFSDFDRRFDEIFHRPS